MRLVDNCIINRKVLKVCDQIGFTRKIHRQTKAYPNLRIRCNQSRSIPSYLQFKMIRCPAWAFTERIEVKKPFFLCESEVTQELYREVMGYNPSEHQGINYPNSDRCPVESMSVYDAILFCNKLSLLFGLKPYYKLSNIIIKKDHIRKAQYTINKDSNGFKLPCYYEWMCAGFAGTENKWSGCNNEEDLADYVWNDTNSLDRTHPIKDKKPNGWGFYDMSGNVSEFAFYFKDEDHKGFNMGGSFKEGPGHPNDKNKYQKLKIWDYHNYVDLGWGDYYAGFRVSRNIIS